MNNDINNIKNNIENIRRAIEESATACGRKASDIKLVAVTKTHSVEEMLIASESADALGENRVQEAMAKKRLWPSTNRSQWRLLGHLQNNKVRKALQLFDTVDSLDSVDLAMTLNRVSQEMTRVTSVLIEVNTSGESSKSGVALGKFYELLDRVLTCRNLSLEGLMTIGPLSENESDVRRAFAQARALSEKARALSALPLSILSMGMSYDFRWAITEGSTMVRIGTALFGSRE